MLNQGGMDLMWSNKFFLMAQWPFMIQRQVMVSQG